MLSKAVFSPDRRYRYHLLRQWRPGERMTFITYHPSGVADENVDDSLVRRCMRFAKRDGYGGIEVVNLFGYRADKLSGLVEAEDPEGPYNWDWVNLCLSNPPPVVAAWGDGVKDFARRSVSYQHIWDRDERLRRKIVLVSLGTTKRGNPRNPVYAPNGSPMLRWPPSRRHPNQ